MPQRPKVHQPYKPAHRKDAQAEACRIRSSAQWKKVRAMFIRAHPMCCDVFGDHKRSGRTTPATQVHHITPVQVRPDLALSFENLAPICDDCHGTVEGMARAGKPTAHLFKAWLLEHKDEGVICL